MWSQIQNISKKLRKNRPQAAGAGKTACPTVDSKQLALVAQAVSPADFDFFTASNPSSHTIDDRLLWSVALAVGQTIVFCGLPGCEAARVFNGANLRNACGKLCGECLQIWPKWRCLWEFQEFEPRRSRLVNANGYLTLQAIHGLGGDLLPKLRNGHDEMAIFHIGR
jgi:hypothetical protein